MLSPPEEPAPPAPLHPASSAQAAAAAIRVRIVCGAGMVMAGSRGSVGSVGSVRVRGVRNQATRGRADRVVRSGAVVAPVRRG